MTLPSLTADALALSRTPVRLAVESGDASAHAQEVPRAEIEARLEIADYVTGELPRKLAPSWSREIVEELLAYEGLPPERQLEEFRPILQQNLEKWERALKNTEKMIEATGRKRETGTKQGGMEALLNLTTIMTVGPQKKMVTTLRKALVKMEIYQNSPQSINPTMAVRSILACFE